MNSTGPPVGIGNCCHVLPPSVVCNRTPIERLPGSVTTTQPCCLSTKSTWAESVSANPGSGRPAGEVDHEEPPSVVALITSCARLLAEEDTTHPFLVFWKYTPMIAPAGTPGGVTAVQVCPPFEVMERAPAVRTQPVFPRTSCAARTGNEGARCGLALADAVDRKSTRLNSSHVEISYAVFCLKKKNR